MLCLILVALLYGLLSFVCALLPIEGRAQSIATDDPPIFVCASLAHTDIVVPLSDKAGEWRAAFSAVADDASDDAYIAIGWGDLGFFLEAPRWRDLRAETVFRAFVGASPTVLRVLAVHAPSPASGCVKILADRVGRETLSKFIVASTESDGSGLPRLIANPSAREAYYAAKGRYSPWRTCNVWASEALAAAGMPAAWWAPFSFGVTWPLGRGEE